MFGYVLFVAFVMIPVGLLLRTILIGRARGSSAAIPLLEGISETQQASAVDGGAATTSAEQSSSGVEPLSLSKVESLRLVKQASAKLPREALIEDLQERAEAGMCLVCSSTARMPAPEVRVVPMAFSWLARWLGAIPIERIVIEPRPTSSTMLFCAHHHAMALKQLDERVASCALDQAEFSRKQNDDWRTYQRFGLIEEMRLREKEILADGQKKRKTKLLALPAANQANGTG